LGLNGQNFGFCHGTKDQIMFDMILFCTEFSSLHLLLALTALGRAEARKLQQPVVFFCFLML
jgi:hypothetical protein